MTGRETEAGGGVEDGGTSGLHSPDQGQLLPSHQHWDWVKRHLQEGLEPQVAQIQLGDQVGPVAAEVTTGRQAGQGMRRKSRETLSGAGQR